jgi:hypothetical protein
VERERRSAEERARQERKTIARAARAVQLHREARPEPEDQSSD